MVQKETFQAVHSAEVRALFQHLGLLSDLESGAIKCHACGDAISLTSFRALTRSGGELRLSCDKAPCLLSLASLAQEAR